ncbi:MAG: GHKL domain-containing protein [Lachnospiraceae bacterium]|nr:GHKL domain-containing protein [Lachnospiraceae bacterium]
MIYWLDILAYGIRAVLLLYLCDGMIVFKEKYTKQGKYIFFLLFVIWGYWLANSAWLGKILYGEDGNFERSGISIVKLILMMAVCFFLIDLFYSGNTLIKAYLVLLYNTIAELAKFGIHGLWSLIAGALYDQLINQVLKEEIPFGDIDKFNHFLQVYQYVWQIVLMLLFTVIALLTIHVIRKYRQSMHEISRQGILFLMLSPAVGMAFSFVLRCIFFTRIGAQIEYIYDKHVGMYAIVPLMAFLCLLSIVYSVKIYEQLMSAQEEKSSLLFYKQQLSDMTEHVQEMERLYDSIRGMRHDMNNYIADMEQLLSAGSQYTNSDGEVGAEAEKYLNHMKDALDVMTLKYSTGNPVTDVIMNRKGQECEKGGICLASDFIFPEQIGIEAFDMGILLNNALDNAIEGCRKCIGKNALEIRVRSYRKGRMFFLRIENDCNGQSVIYTNENILQTTKEDDWMHGIGLKNMRSVVERYYGTMSYEIRDNVFYLTIMLQEKGILG